ncbi:LPS export ABC transporter periplasmic protein LptC [Candidatus Liberibacter africanus]|nr:LPS export ABC transporter periplasmic protein LptC [Candidatus Liberibacter africanus]
MNDVDQLDRIGKISSQRREYRKHVKFIGFLNFFLPVITIFMICWLSFSSWEYARNFSKPLVDFLGFEPMVMKKFILSDYSENQVRYSLMAEHAKIGFNSKNIVFLKNFELSIPIEKDDNMMVVASSANLDLRNNVLDITQPFKIILKDNVQLDFKNAYLDINKLAISSASPVIVTHSDFVISAQSVKIDKNSRNAIFVGDVSVIMKPEILQRKK